MLIGYSRLVEEPSYKIAGPNNAVDLVHRKLNPSQLLNMKRRISSRAVCALQGSASEIPICRQLLEQNSDDVSLSTIPFSLSFPNSTVAACLCPPAPRFPQRR
jgi:hypothetical protein